MVLTHHVLVLITLSHIRVVAAMVSWSPLTSCIFLVALPTVLAFSALALLVGGTGLLRFHLVLASLASAGCLWLLAASKYISGLDSGSGVGVHLHAMLVQLDGLAGGQLLARVSEQGVEYSILVAPFLFLAALGSYALLVVGINLYRFNDCEEAAEELTKVRGRGSSLGSTGSVGVAQQGPLSALRPRPPSLSAACTPALALTNSPPTHAPTWQDVEAMRKKLKAKGFKGN